MPMTTPLKQDVLKEFQTIPGVGKTIAGDLWNIGLRSLQELNGNDPDELYAKMCLAQGMRIDRCMLYVLRCAVYYASHEEHDPRLLKWWSWKD
jgi:Pathogenicity locus